MKDIHSCTCAGSSSYVNIVYEYLWVIVYIRTSPKWHEVVYQWLLEDNQFKSNTWFEHTVELYGRERKSERKWLLFDFVSRRKWKTNFAFEVLFLTTDRHDLQWEKKGVSWHFLLIPYQIMFCWGSIKVAPILMYFKVNINSRIFIHI